MRSNGTACQMGDNCVAQGNVCTNNGNDVCLSLAVGTTTCEGGSQTNNEQCD
jgi:hypothetical protein